MEDHRCCKSLDNGHQCRGQDPETRRQTTTNSPRQENLLRLAAYLGIPEAPYYSITLSRCYQVYTAQSLQQSAGVPVCADGV